MKRHSHFYPLAALVLLHHLMMTGCTAMKRLSLGTDQSALLALKAHITSGQQEFLSKNWSSAAAASSVCDWIGVQCGSRHQRVTALNISNMGLTGTIPPDLGNLSFLVSLDLRNNSFHGNLLEELSHLRRLRFIRFSKNNFTGEIPMWFVGQIPLSLCKFSHLQVLDLSNNRFSGHIPKEIGNLEKLKELYLSTNNLTGTIPREIGNLQSLQRLNLEWNQIAGSIPKEIGNLTMLTELYFANNSLTGTIPPEMGNLYQLENLQLSYNGLIGSIPHGIFNLSALRNIGLQSNLLSGSLPPDLGYRLPKLLFIDLAWNNLGGVIPVSITNCSRSRILNFARNRFTDLGPNPLNGLLPASIGNLSASLGILILETSGIKGTIPSQTGNLTNLVLLDLQSNHLTGGIPTAFKDLQNLQGLTVGDNNLNDTLDKLCSLHSLNSVDLTTNQFSGSIPECFGNMTSLRELELGNNFLVSAIPNSFWKLKDLLELNLSSNSLNASLPLEVGNLKAITSIDVSANQFSGDIPRTTGDLQNLVILNLSQNQFHGSIPDFGSVYKGILNDGRSIAVKVFNLELEGVLKSFDVECKVLKNLRHRNLVKVISGCWNQDFRALGLEYMCNGSLEKWLYSDNYFLDTLQRLNILIDVASAVQYLHEEYSTPVIHCDLKPSNVLLDEDMVAHVSDFGIAKMLEKEESFAWTRTLATIGYIAPEYGSEGLISAKCDIYSYGIMLMEVFSRRKPNDEMFAGNLNLKSWINNSLPDSILRVLSSILELALKCVCESPSERVSMKVTLETLKKIKLKFLRVMEVDS
ncbi:unnamed protein product [Coffea canephora]|uniref:non-specific serine/threonine protein kinase n=1 Tax=Coffea canephora TaxID=49390 RepID=A0A068UJ55_COFCA|nr:unnamed protein product [Coffea canephora]